MKRVLFFLLIFSPTLLFSQNKEVMYLGVNGKMGEVETPAIRKEIKNGVFKKEKVTTSILNDGRWQFLFSEKIKVINESEYKIKVRGDAFSGRITRRFGEQENGRWKFTDWMDEKIKRVGYSTSKIPLILDGEITDFYKSGQIKSISQYKNNELLTNKNWLPTGEQDVDNIFYSVDSVPLFKPGVQYLHKHILETFKESDVDVGEVSGRVVVGFVVRTDGKIDGVRIVKGIVGQVNAVALEAFKTIKGKWKPAKLAGKTVNYFQLFPINFLTQQYDFDYLALKGSTLYWVIN